MQNNKNKPIGHNRVKLTNEELLAGKCMPDSNIPTNSAIKSPDDILGKRLNRSQMKTPADIILSSPIHNKELELLKAKHAEDMEKWYQYEKRVNEWLVQATRVVERLKLELKKKENVETELIAAKKEVESLRNIINNSVSQNKKLLNSLLEE